MQNHHIILFDGVCNFCNYWVNFIIDRDKDDIFRFAALQSEAGQKLLNKFNLKAEDFNTFILIEGEIYFTKSTAALMIARKLNFPFKVLYYFIFIPKFLRDLIYSLIATNRYKFFGKRDICRIPSENEKEKFLD
ncbi:MAG: thiol-disulfide oxidoreductase DCC family protein [Ignavibacteria bacterium]|nr:MAG: thiol-disulfide oxidoreductase DCC family protein [Ignavibacteria bacterium]